MFPPFIIAHSLCRFNFLCYDGLERTQTPGNAYSDQEAFSMKKAKRIFALAGVILLIGLYISTLVFTFIDTALSRKLLNASVALTILLPILFYGIRLMYRVLKRDE